jgi:transposase
MLENVFLEHVSEWQKGFKDRRESLQHDEGKVRPSTSRTEELTKVVPKSLAEDGTLSVWTLEEMTGSNRGTVYKILVKHLKKKDMCTHFVPHLLMPDQKLQ